MSFTKKFKLRKRRDQNNDDGTEGGEVIPMRHWKSKRNGSSSRFAGSLMQYSENSALPPKKHVSEVGPSVTQSPLPSICSPRSTSIFVRLLFAFLPRLGLVDLVSPAVWRSAFIEIVGTTLVVFLSILAVLSSPGNLLLVAILHIPILALLIISAAAPSGGHLNSLITFSTILTRHTTVVRGILYIISQATGSVLGAGLARILIAHDQAESTHLAGCSRGEFRLYQLFIAEVTFDFALLFVAFGTALDPRQGAVYGPVLAPIFIGIWTSTLIYISGSGFAGGSLFTKGYTGAGMNPVRCFGPQIILWVEGTGGGSEHWVYWVAAGLAAAIHAVIYNLSPPHHVDMYEKMKKETTELKIVKKSNNKTVIRTEQVTHAQDHEGEEEEEEDIGEERINSTEETEVDEEVSV